MTEEELGLLAIGLQCVDNLQKTKQLIIDTDKILHSVMYDPKFRQLLNDINNLNMLLKAKKNELEEQQKKLAMAQKYNLIEQIKTIIVTNQAIMDNIDTIQKNLFNKTSQIQSYI